MEGNYYKCIARGDIKPLEKYLRELNHPYTDETGIYGEATIVFYSDEDTLNGIKKQNKLNLTVIPISRGCREDDRNFR